MTGTDYQRTSAYVVRAGSETAHLSIPAWCKGQITVRVLTANLMTATGLTCRELLGVELAVTANLAAVVDTDVDPHAFHRARRSAASSNSQPAAATAVSIVPPSGRSWPRSTPFSPDQRGVGPKPVSTGLPE